MDEQGCVPLELYWALSSPMRMTLLKTSFLVREPWGKANFLCQSPRVEAWKSGLEVYLIRKSACFYVGCFAPLRSLLFSQTLDQLVFVRSGLDVQALKQIDSKTVISLVYSVVYVKKDCTNICSYIYVVLIALVLIFKYHCLEVIFIFCRSKDLNPFFLLLLLPKCFLILATFVDGSILFKVIWSADFFHTLISNGWTEHSPGYLTGFAVHFSAAKRGANFEMDGHLSFSLRRGKAWLGRLHRSHNSEMLFCFHWNCVL